MRASAATSRPPGGPGRRLLARLCPIAGFYKYAVEEELLGHSPAVHVRRPRLDYESPATGLDRDEVGVLLVAAGLGTAAEHALISLPALNGLRVSEATGADIEALGTERGHRTLAITRKAGKKAVIPLAPRTARAIDLAVGERCEGPIAGLGQRRGAITGIPPDDDPARCPVVALLRWNGYGQSDNPPADSTHQLEHACETVSQAGASPLAQFTANQATPVTSVTPCT